jgi:hypothetical protein
MELLENFNTKNFEFELINNGTAIVCYHYYAKHLKSCIKICCNIPDVNLGTIKKSVSFIKKEISEAKKNILPLHGCTHYLDNIKL